MSKARRTFQCFNCHRPYSLTQDLTGKRRLLVACPFCETEAVVDLAPYLSEIQLTYESTGGQKATETTYHLPDIIPTTPRPANEIKD